MTELRFPWEFEPRDYQLPLLRAVDRGVKRGISVWHRRSGKDKTFINIVGKKSVERKGTYYYYFPTQSLARKILWNGMDKDGFRFMDHFPSDGIKRKNDRDMLIEFKWGSVFQIIGTDQLDVVGTNPVGCVFSEYSLQNPKAWQYIQPILLENDGWALFNFTPRGHNHAYDLLKKVRGESSWFTEVLTIEDTGVVDVEAVEDDVRIGLISREMARQEYWCSFEMGVEGSYYTGCMGICEEEGRIGDFGLRDDEKVYTFWDLGMDNAMAIWFAQFYDGKIVLIDHYENTNEAMGHYAGVLKERAEKRGYDYGGHYAPWDVVKRESNALTVQRNAEKVGMYFERVKRTASVSDDIELVRRLFGKFHFDAVNCEYGLTCVRQYHQKKDENASIEGRPVFLNKPDHDETSNTNDALRTLCRAYELRLIRPSPFAAIGGVPLGGEGLVTDGASYNYLEGGGAGGGVGGRPRPRLWERDLTAGAGVGEKYSGVRQDLPKSYIKGGRRDGWR